MLGRRKPSIEDMAVDPTVRKSDVTTTRRPSFEVVALLLQGGGALGAYQAGVYEALAEAGIYPDWIAGMSIGGASSGCM
jgi:NTE family protein